MLVAIAFCEMIPARLAPRPVILISDLHIVGLATLHLLTNVYTLGPVSPALDDNVARLGWTGTRLDLADADRANDR